MSHSLLATALVALLITSGCRHTATPGPGSAPRPASELKAGCVQGSSDDCQALVDQQKDHASLRATVLELDPELDAKCADGRVGACLWRAWLWTYLMPHGELPWAQIARDHGRACKLGSSESCFRLAEQQETDLRVDSEDWPLPLYEAACEFGMERGCIRSQSLKREQEDRAMRPTPQAAPEPPQASSPAAIDTPLLVKVIDSRRELTKACYQRELEKRPDLGGRLEYRFTVLPSGRVIDAVLTKRSLPSPSVAACILGVLRDAKFPGVAGRLPTVVSYPFAFRSSEATITAAELRASCVHGNRVDCQALIEGASDDENRRSELAEVDKALDAVCTKGTRSPVRIEGGCGPAWVRSRSFPGRRSPRRMNTAACLGSAEACLRLAELHEVPLGISKDEADALRHYSTQPALSATRPPAPAAHRCDRSRRHYLQPHRRGGRGREGAHRRPGQGRHRQGHPRQPGAGQGLLREPPRGAGRSPW